MFCGGVAGLCFWTCIFPLDVIKSRIQVRLLHLGVEDCSEEMLRQKSNAIKNQLGHPKLTPRWFFMA